MSENLKTIALTIVDPNGIGPEIAVKAAGLLGTENIRVVLVGDEYVERCAYRASLQRFIGAA